jgi:hypothetical protein
VPCSLPGGFSVWKQGGFLEKKLPSVASAVIAMRFIGRHFLLFVDSNWYVYVLDIRTSQFWAVYQLTKKPSAILILKTFGGPELCVGHSTIAHRFDICIPWDVWVNNTSQVLRIHNCPRFNEAARVVLHCQNKVFDFCSPRTGKVLTTASSTISAQPTECFYDRNLNVKETMNEITFSEFKHDRLFVLMPDAKLALFTTAENPCVEDRLIDVQFTSMTICHLNAVPVYCFASPLGELFFYDYFTLEVLGRHLIERKSILRIYSHTPTQSIVCIFTDGALCFDLQLLKVSGDSVTVPDGRVSGLGHSLLLFGYEDGGSTVLKSRHRV